MLRQIHNHGLAGGGFQRLRPQRLAPSPNKSASFCRRQSRQASFKRRSRVPIRPKRDFHTLARCRYRCRAGPAGHDLPARPRASAVVGRRHTAQPNAGLRKRQQTSVPPARSPGGCAPGDRICCSGASRRPRCTAMFRTPASSRGGARRWSSSAAAVERPSASTPSTNSTRSDALARFPHSAWPGALRPSRKSSMAPSRFEVCHGTVLMAICTSYKCTWPRACQTVPVEAAAQATPSDLRLLRCRARAGSNIARSHIDVQRAGPSTFSSSVSAPTRSPHCTCLLRSASSWLRATLTVTGIDTSGLQRLC